jgi:unsaturated rhamnogalacturonyl hydrolase
MDSNAAPGLSGGTPPARPPGEKEGNPMTHPIRRTAAAGLVALLAAGLMTAGTGPAAAGTTPGADIAASTLYEAENATIFHGTVDSDHPGFTGSGFVNSTNEVGAYVEWTVNAAAAGSQTLTFRYANGTTANRPAAVTVNGSALPTPSFPPTGSWNNWSTQSATVNLPAGDSLVRATSTTAGGLANLDSLTVGDGAPPPPPPPVPGTDWSVAMVNSTMARGTITGWSYPNGLTLYGAYLVYQRTRNRTYLNWIHDFGLRHTDSSGHIDNGFSNLDSMMPGRVMIVLLREFPNEATRWRNAARQVRNRFGNSQTSPTDFTKYPRTSDGGFWHATSASRQGQLWSDGVFMADPFLAEWATYGATSQADRDASLDQAARQLQIYASHLQQPNGLMKHAYDEPRDEDWSDNTTGLAPEYWCRAIGWFGMAATQILDLLPANHPRRTAVINIVRNLVRGFATFQDLGGQPPTAGRGSGRWFQVVDKGNRSDNWTETSCSSMYTYTIDKAIEDGYVDGATYQANADRGYQGVLNRISLGGDGRTNLTEISIGTNVGDYNYYINRERRTNDAHGLGAFLIMNEQLQF